MAKKLNNPRWVAAFALQRVEEGAYSNIILDQLLRETSLKPVDKRLATRIFYGTLSQQRLIDWVWEKLRPQFVEDTDPFMRALLRTALYQMRFLKRIPTHAVLQESVEVAKRMRGQGAAGFANALLRKASKRADFAFESTGDTTQDLAIEYTLSDDLASLLVAQFELDEAKEIAQSFQDVPKISLRTQTSRTKREALRLALDAEPSRIAPQGLIAAKWSDAIKASVDEGLCAVQDEGSQLVPEALLPFESEESDKVWTIWDTCAGQGGKAMQIMDYLEAHALKARLVCTDLYDTKLKRLQSAQKKYFPKQSLTMRAMDLSEPGSITHAPFDAILIDAPCSGLGVLRRHPEGKLKKSLNDIEDLAALQANLLQNVAKHLKPQGVLVYAVCTFTKQETTDQIEAFLKAHPHFVLDPLPEALAKHAGDALTLQLLPHKHGCDGFFVAKFRRLRK